MRKSQSGTTLFGDVEGVQQDAEAASVPVLTAERGARLIVVANRLPVSAAYNSEGKWTLQAWPHEPDGLDVRPSLLPCCQLRLCALLISHLYLCPTSDIL